MSSNLWTILCIVISNSLYTELCVLTQIQNLSIKSLLVLWCGKVQNILFWKLEAIFFFSIVGMCLWDLSATCSQLWTNGIYRQHHLEPFKDLFYWKLLLVWHSVSCNSESVLCILYRTMKKPPLMFWSGQEAVVVRWGSRSYSLWKMPAVWLLSNGIYPFIHPLNRIHIAICGVLLM